jgi:hypothetical protein
MNESTKYSTRGLRKKDWRGNKGKGKGCLLNQKGRTRKKANNLRRQRKHKPKLKDKHHQCQNKAIPLWTIQTEASLIMSRKMIRLSPRGQITECSPKERTARESSQKDNDFGKQLTYDLRKLNHPI